MNDKLAKVGIQTDDHVETLWAEPLGFNRYRLQNSPFFAYGVSWQDVVEAIPDETGMPMMRRVLEKSGRRTIRVILETGPTSDPEAQLVLNGVNALGCTYEGLNDRYVSVDLPPAADLERVAEYLTDRGVHWEHADPTYEDFHAAH